MNTYHLHNNVIAVVLYWGLVNVTSTVFPHMVWEVRTYSNFFCVYSLEFIQESHPTLLRCKHSPKAHINSEVSVDFICLVDWQATSSTASDHREIQYHLTLFDWGDACCKSYIAYAGMLNNHAIFWCSIFCDVFF